MSNRSLDIDEIRKHLRRYRSLLLVGTGANVQTMLSAMFRETIYIALSTLLVFGLTGCAKRPDEMRVNTDFNSLNKMLSGVDEAYAGCAFIKESITPKDKGDRGEGWQEFEMNVKITCGNRISRRRVRILYEYVIDFKNHAGPYWELASWGYDRPLP